MPGNAQPPIGRRWLPYVWAVTAVAVRPPLLRKPFSPDERVRAVGALLAAKGGAVRA